MYLLNICHNPDILKVILIIKTLLKIVTIVVPIAMIISISLAYMKAVSNVDELPKAKKKTVNTCIAAVLIFLIPTFANLITVIAAPPGASANGCLSNLSAERIDVLYNIQAQQLVNMYEQTYETTHYTNALLSLKEVKNANLIESLGNKLNEIKTKAEEEQQKASDLEKEIKKLNDTSTGEEKNSIKNEISSIKHYQTKKQLAKSFENKTGDLLEVSPEKNMVIDSWILALVDPAQGGCANKSTVLSYIEAQISEEEGKSKAIALVNEACPESENTLGNIFKNFFKNLFN